MLSLLLLLLLACLIALAAGLLRLRHYRQRGEEVPAAKAARPAGCCGMHAVCEKQLEQAANEAPVYYEDEELDAYAHRAPQDYTSEEVEQFQDILFTMRPEEVPSWLHSLELRHVALPAELHDDVLMIVGEVTERAN